jgi:hypothetical protein
MAIVPVSFGKMPLGQMPLAKLQLVKVIWSNAGRLKCLAKSQMVEWQSFELKID